MKRIYLILFALALVLTNKSALAQRFNGVKVLSAPIVFTTNTIEYVSDNTFDLQNGFSVTPGAGQSFSLEIIDKIPGSADVNRNWIMSTTYDGLGNKIGLSKSFFNDLGMHTQSQVMNFRYNEFLASETLYDEYGRACITTLPATINAEGFTYRSDFITKAGQHYNYSNFSSSKTFDPDAIDNTTKGTLGWYYSNNNSLESYVATTGFPYSRADFYGDGSNEIRRVTSPGDELRLGTDRQGISGTLPVVKELTHYIGIRNKFFLPTSTSPSAYQKLMVDENNNYSVGIYDNANKLLMSAMEGNLLKVDNIQTFDIRWDKGPILWRFYIFDPMTANLSTNGQIKYLLNENISGVPGKGFYEVTQVTNGAVTTLTYSNSYDNISYNFYDDAGRLIASIAPEGVKALLTNGVNFYTDKNAIPYTTLYKYDFDGRLIESKDPDAGLSKYMYRKDGGIRFSENQVQRENGSFSYTNYDEVGRPLESGEFVVGTSGLSFNSAPLIDLLEKVNIEGELTGGNSIKRDWARTYYDLPDPSFASSTGLTREQTFVNGDVSYIENANSKTWFSYDEQGRKKCSVQKINALGADNNSKVKTIDYTYDLLGNLLQVAYQAGKSDAFYHHYSYDADKRLYQVYTSLDGSTKSLQATYHRYLHGPLKRVELADKLQGIDYVYTVQGWLKSINNTNTSNDPGKDGTNAFAPDVFGMTMDYFSGDYVRASSGIGSINVPGDVVSNFNGNIKAVASNTWKSATSLLNFPISYAYQYDKKNQLIKAMWGEDNSSTSNYSYTANTYGMQISQYDQNGNILNANVGGAMQYSYSNSNRLNSLIQAADAHSFSYNSIGQMTSRSFTGAAQNSINKNLKFSYNVTGLVNTVSNSNNVDKAGFLYNEQGLRLRKTTFKEDGTISYYTWYIYDTNGNVMSIYNQDATNNVTQTELPIYGSGRLGMAYRYYSINSNTYNYSYTLSDHLGNVRATIGRDKINGKANILNWSDYNPWGSSITGRDIVISQSSRYGYQGQYAEKDSETGLNNFELRMYDPSIGRWLTPDPKRQYSSPYIGMGNNPVNGIDPDGAWNIVPPWFKNKNTGEVKWFDKNPGKDWEDVSNNNVFTAYGAEIVVNQYGQLKEKYPSTWYLFVPGPNPYLPPQAPDAIGVSVGGNFFYGPGAGSSATLVFNFRNPGTQLYWNNERGVGADVSVGAGVSFINFTNDETWRDDFTADYTTGEVGILGLSLNHSENYDMSKKVHGNLVNSVGIGFSVGSKQVPLSVIGGKLVRGYTYKLNMPWQN